jgi:carboxypeptidase family protein/TonB-dependent receptor-like protein
MKRAFCVVFLFCVLVAFSGQSLHAQLADRAEITGLVTDASGAGVPDAKVSITNQNTGSKIEVGTNNAGNYSTPQLSLGTYTVEVEKEGFKHATHTGIVLTGGLTYRQDVKLELGSVTQSVEVEGGAQMINTENSTVSHTIGNDYYRDLPGVMGADIRLAESLLQLQPGFVPMQPNGDAIFRGSQFTSRINGGQTMATENWFDGAAFGYAEGHQGTQESSVPYPSVQEMTVVENTFSAQYGHTSGGFVTYATKSGTDKLHGNVYNFLTTDRLDAANFFLRKRLPLTQDNWGAAVGGPIPKITKWGKTFWFFNVDGLDYHSTVNTGFVNTLPTPAQRGGDFSGAGLLDTTSIVAHDALGRPIYQGEIFNPATTRLVGGKLVRDGYGFDPTTGLPIAGQANIIPANDPLRSSLAAFVIPNIPALDRNTLRQNGFGGNSDDNNKIDVRTWLFRVDHTFNNKFSISNTYYQNNRPRTAHCGGPQGCNTVHNGQTDSAANDTYIGQGFFQRITNHFEHLQMNWVIKPNLFNHTTLAYDRWHMQGNQLAGGVGWNKKLGLGLPDQPAFNNAGFPQLNFNGPIGYTHYGTPWASGGSDINNRYQFLDDITWITGKHTIKAGVEFRYMTFPQTGWAVNTGGNFNFDSHETAGYDATGANLNTTTGNEFASFMLGQVDSANFSAPFSYMPKMKYGSPWINDDFKLTPKLTLTLGLRFDWQSGLSEQHGKFSTFDPTAANPVGHLGATVFGGSKPIGNSSWSVGPRFGFAYQIKNKTVIRGGYGMYYAGAQADSWDPYPVDGYQTNPTAPNTTNGRFPAFYFNGNSACPAQATALGVPCSWPTGSIVLPPQLRADISNGGNPVGVDPKTYTMPRYQNWSISFQRQLGDNMAIDIAYVGNHGTRLIDGRSAAGVYDNMNAGSVLGLGANVLGALFTKGVPDATAIAAGFTTPPFPGFSGTVAQSLRAWPQYQQINWRYFPLGNSHYNALQASFDRRMSHGLQLRVAYTYSKLMNNGSETGLGAGGPPVQNPSDMRNLYSVSSDDVPHIFTFGWIYQLPFGKGKAVGKNASGALDKIIGDWQISATQTYQSGRPLSITTANNLGGFLFNYAKFPNKAGNGLTGTFKDPATDSYLNQAGWTDPGALAFGNALRQDASVRGFKYFNEDFSIFKDTYFGEGRYVRVQADAGNIFNRVFFCPADQFWLPNNGNGNFGHTGSQCNIPRRVQIGLQIFF